MDGIATSGLFPEGEEESSRRPMRRFCGGTVAFLVSLALKKGVWSELLTEKNSPPVPSQGIRGHDHNWDHDL